MKPTEKKSDAAESRTVPFSVAGIVCFVVALFLGAGSWYLFGTNRRLSPERNVTAVQTSSQNSVGELSSSVNNSAPTPAASPTAEIKKAPAGELFVDGGEVTLGGADDNLPLRRVAVESFAVGETEVTNAQYAEFVEETGHNSPANWKDGKFPSDRANYPAVGVSWADANDYCEWLSKKLGATVRLPNEAEWELAARGNTNFKFPWGSEWNDEALESAETNRRVRPVKSFPKGRSPVGAYDMVGNVWEWTSDSFVDGIGNPVLFEKAKQRVIKGGSAYDERKLLTIKTHLPRPENKSSEFLGFRYVVIRR